eukprot:scaffold5528_cov27-Tisochrysis_lutea.AAC.5
MPVRSAASFSSRPFTVITSSFVRQKMRAGRRMRWRSAQPPFPNPMHLQMTRISASRRCRRSWTQMERLSRQARRTRKSSLPRGRDSVQRAEDSSPARLP